MKKVLKKTSVSRAVKKDWNKLWQQTQYTSTSLLHFDVQLNTSFLQIKVK